MAKKGTELDEWGKTINRWFEVEYALGLRPKTKKKNKHTPKKSRTIK